MADDPHNTSDISDPVEAGSPREDSETKTARRELKQTSISEKQLRLPASQQSLEDKSGSDDETAQQNAAERRATPDNTAHLSPHDQFREQVSSPKKKRAHEELDEQKDSEQGPANGGAAASQAANGSAGASRTDRSEPEKKRARDHDGDKSDMDSTSDDKKHISTAETKAQPSTATETGEETTAEGASQLKETKAEEPQTSTSTFTASGFAKHAASTQSPFGALGSSGKPSLFGATSSTQPSAFGGTAVSQPAAAPKLVFSSSSGSSPFGALGASKPSGEPGAPPKLSFASSGSASPFETSGLNGKPSGFGGGGTFGSAGSFGAGKTFGSGFSAASATGGPRLTSFASKPGEAFKSDKPARPFGAPESEDEQSGDEDEEEDGEAGAETAEDNSDDKDKEESKPASDDKKKPRLQRIEVDDGESGEITVLAVRAKMFQMEKGSSWKERGAGMLKVNVPKDTVDIDEQGLVDVTSFDASVLEGDETTRVRLILRQDHTLRVILNTPIVPAMKFQLNQKLKAAFILFTAFEGNEVKQVQMKMSEANATHFMDRMNLLQKQLADV